MFLIFANLLQREPLLSAGARQTSRPPQVAQPKKSLPVALLRYVCSVLMLQLAECVITIQDSLKPIEVEVLKIEELVNDINKELRCK